MTLVMFQALPLLLPSFLLCIGWSNLATQNPGFFGEAGVLIAPSGLTGCVFVLGLPSALSYGLLSHIRFSSLGILEAIDHGVSNFLLPTTGILTALYVGWRLERAFVLDEADLGESRIGIIWLWLVRILVPVTILGILLQSAESL